MHAFYQSFSVRKACRMLAEAQQGSSPGQGGGVSTSMKWIFAALGLNVIHTVDRAKIAKVLHDFAQEQL